MDSSVQEKKEAMEPWPHQYGYHLACEMLMFTIGNATTTLSETLNAFRRSKDLKRMLVCGIQG